MNYVWTTCPQCGCQITIHFVAHPEKLVGSVRRWSTDRTINDGRPLEVPRAEVAGDGGFRTACVCGGPLSIAGGSIEHATTERPAV